MALYDNLFGLMDLQAAQVLVTSNDFTENVFKENLCATVEDLLSMNVVCCYAVICKASSAHDPLCKASNMHEVFLHPVPQGLEIGLKSSAL